jgi:hypothetical protein
MLGQSSTGRTYTRDAYVPVRRDAHAEVEKINGWLHISAFPFSNFKESVLDRSDGRAPQDFEFAGSSFGVLILSGNSVGVFESATAPIREPFLN